MMSGRYFPRVLSIRTFSESESGRSCQCFPDRSGKDMSGRYSAQIHERIPRNLGSHGRAIFRIVETDPTSQSQARPRHYSRGSAFRQGTHDWSHLPKHRDTEGQAQHPRNKAWLRDIEQRARANFHHFRFSRASTNTCEKREID